jgi:hypothetical protein
VSFPVSLLGSNLKNLKIITEGTNLVRQLVECYRITPIFFI